MQNAIHINDTKKRPWGRLLLLLVSIGVGASGVFFANTYISEEIQSIRQQFQKTEPMVDVVVPSQKLYRGDVITEAVMSLREIPAQYVDTNSVTAQTYEIAKGQRLEFDIDAGVALLFAHLEGGVNPTFSGKVPDGMRALTVHVDEINSVSGFLQPKDRIDLLFTYGNGDKQKIRPLIDNLTVIATGVQTMVDKTGHDNQRMFTTITVQVDPLEAKKISLAQQIGSLTAVLRNPDDDKAISTDVITLASLLNEPDPPKPVVASKPAPRAPAPPKVRAIEYIIGGQR